MSNQPSEAVGGEASAVAERILLEGQIRSRLSRQLSADDAPADGGRQLVYFSRPLEPCLQVGPTCGLVALLMAGQLMRTPASPAPRPEQLPALLQLAVQHRLTKQGEMFAGRWSDADPGAVSCF